ncbi:MAG TPA: hypothetical protein VH023_00395 [Rhodopila sp.]|nr:hypothetical protein [Rhodopila sp.]
MGSWAQVYDWHNVIIKHSKPGEPDKEETFRVMNNLRMIICGCSRWSAAGGGAGCLHRKLRAGTGLPQTQSDDR